jgi:deoxyribodipyrimidine photo-lyase
MDGATASRSDFTQAARSTPQSGVMWHLVWFKRDLRSADHEPLARAAARGPVLPLYVVEPGLWAQPDASGRQWAFVRECLVGLRGELAALGLPLLVRVGEVTQVLDELRRKAGIASLASHQETGNAWTFARDRRVAAWCRANGIDWREHAAFGVVRGLRERSAWSTQWERRMTRPTSPLRPAPQPALPLDAGGIPDWPTPALAADACPGRQRGGRAEGMSLLDSFLTRRGREYTRRMSSPLSAESACSRLSPHLAWGSVGLREVLQRVRLERGRRGDAGRLDAFARADPGCPLRGDDPRRAPDPWRRSLAAFESRLHWHCHFIQKLESEPAIEFRNMHRGFDGLREGSVDADRLAAWQRGETGWPFVDACLRQLAATGWINFRMRAMLVAVASYHLWLHWREPALHLARCFTDYEPGIHYPQVQMQSGVTGINIPRIYNPIKQGLDQDPQGAYVRRWLPELAGVPDAFLHTPWHLNASQQRAAGCRIGRDYPAPLLDHEQAAREARARYLAWRRQPHMGELAEAVLRQHGSRKRKVASHAAAQASPQAELF